MQPVFVQFIDHEANDFIILFCHHPDAIALAKTTNEVFLRPRKLETLIFDCQNRRHIAANHPTNVNTNGRWFCLLHLGLLSSETARLLGRHPWPHKL